MSNDFYKRLEAVDAQHLAPLVARSLGQDSVRVVDWKFELVTGGFSGESGGALGIIRFVGTGDVGGPSVPWSVMLKVLNSTGAAGVDNPDSWNFWERSIGL